MDKKGQGAIEYLLIIGAAILVVAVVIIALVSVTGQATEGVEGDEAQQAQTFQKCAVSCGLVGGKWENTVCNGHGNTAPDWANDPDALCYAYRGTQ